MRDLSSALAAAQLDVRRFQRAVVKTAAANKLTVKLDDSTELVDVPALSSSPAYAVNDLVVVARDATGPLVIGRLGVSSTPAVEVVPPPVAPPSVKTLRSKTILPSSTGSWRSGGGWRSDDTVRQGDWNSGYGINHGAAFYGRQLKGLGADLTRPRSIRLTYKRLAGGVFGAQAPTVWTLSQSSRPSGAPSRLTSSVGTGVAVNKTATFQLPTGMVDELLDGTAGGLGIYVGGSSPYIVLAGRSDYGSAMALSVSYYA